MSEKAVVLLSGGQDSATCLALAASQYSLVHTLSFDYGQRHVLELTCSARLSSLAKAVSHVEVKVDLSQVSASRLLEKHSEISEPHEILPQLPSSFVPGRNLIFLSLAAAYCRSQGISIVVTGVCQTDYSGYPDCRSVFINSMVETVRFALDFPEFEIITPLMFKTKAEIVLIMQELGKLDWYQHTLTCYNGQQPPCGACPSCKLRAKGFAEAGVGDPVVCGL